MFNGFDFSKSLASNVVSSYFVQRRDLFGFVGCKPSAIEFSRLYLTQKLVKLREVQLPSSRVANKKMQRNAKGTKGAKLPLQLIFNPHPKKIMRLPLDQQNFRLCSVKIPCFAISSLPVSVPVSLRSGFSDACPEPLPNATSGRAVSPLLPPRMADDGGAGESQRDRPRDQQFLVADVL